VTIAKASCSQLKRSEMMYPHVIGTYNCRKNFKSQGIINHVQRCDANKRVYISSLNNLLIEAAKCYTQYALWRASLQPPSTIKENIIARSVLQEDLFSFAYFVRRLIFIQHRKGGVFKGLFVEYIDYNKTGCCALLEQCFTNIMSFV
jgi:hypothetical protein